MELKIRSIKYWLGLVTPIVTSSILAASQSLAANLAFSRGELNFSNINQIPEYTVNSSNTNTFTTVRLGSTLALADTQAVFIDDASASDYSITFSDGHESYARADSLSQLLGSFFVEANETFSLDFSADLELGILADNPESEPAIATGDLSFLLIDSTTQAIYDSFSLLGNLSNQRDGDYLDYHLSENINLTDSSLETSFGRTQEFANASVQGSLQHVFTSPTNLTLVAVTSNQASVKTPEPSNTLALLGLFISIGIGFRVGKTFGSTSKLTQQLQLALAKNSSTTKC